MEGSLSRLLVFLFGGAAWRRSGSPTCLFVAGNGMRRLCCCAPLLAQDGSAVFAA